MAGAPYRRSLMYHAYPGEPLEKLTHEILKSETRPTAVFAENWQVCKVVLAVAQQLGLRVPQDLSYLERSKRPPDRFTCGGDRIRAR